MNKLKDSFFDVYGDPGSTQYDYSISNELDISLYYEIVDNLIPIICEELWGQIFYQISDDLKREKINE